jgi:TusA-related sulfurtransferase
LAKALQIPFVRQMEQSVSKTSKINLIGISWPVNLLHCSRQTDAMQPGDELIIAVADKDVKASLIQFLLAIHDVSFNVVNAGHGYTINVKKNRDGSSGKTSP